MIQIFFRQAGQSERVIDVADGSTVGDAVSSAGLDPTRVHTFMNGSQVSSGTPLTPNARVSAAPAKIDGGNLS